MDKYEKMDLEVIEFEMADVIVTSGEEGRGIDLPPVKV